MKPEVPENNHDDVFQDKEKPGSTEKDEIKPHRVRIPGFIKEEIGLGDVIKRVTYTVGIKPTRGCGCERRAAALNRRVVFFPRRSR